MQVLALDDCRVVSIGSCILQKVIDASKAQTMVQPKDTDFSIIKGNFKGTLEGTWEGPPLGIKDGIWEGIVEGTADEIIDGSWMAKTEGIFDGPEETFLALEAQFA